MLAKFTTGDWGVLARNEYDGHGSYIYYAEILPCGWCLEFEGNGSINSTMKSFSLMNSFSGELEGSK